MKTIILFSLITIGLGLQAQKLEKLWSSKKDMQTPESVLFDKNLKLVFVANMGTVTDSKTGDGFISQMNLKGEITKLKWVTGVNDPKGMAVWEGKLYVSDMDELVVIDIKESKIVKKYPASGAKFLNDVTVSPKGVVFVSDMKDQRIYSLENGTFSSWLKNEKLENVNGLWFENGKLYAGNESVWEIDAKTKELKQLVSETGGIDGLEMLGKDKFIFSNWGGKIFVSEKGKATKLLDTSAEKLNTADIDYVPDEKIVLVPTFFGNNVDAYKLVW